MWRNIRILILLLVLAFVALNTWFDRVYSTDWDIPLRVAVHPINGDGSAVAEGYIRKLDADALRALESFFEQEAAQYGLNMQSPVRFTLAPQLHSLPPALPPRAGPLRAISWSLRTRYWAWRQPTGAGPAPDIELFVLYHDPARTRSLPHSVGLQKGLFGIVHAFADRKMAGSNDVVIAHELLHTLGATDKYDPATNEPAYPEGYAEPEREPRYPQEFAELMGGRIAISARESAIPASLHQVLIGPATAAEIGWPTS